ncbi:endonuclease G [Arcicella aurantiaca]|uniref:Endonuclease G n=1 Tax=Arcicella aurantiaca TaxID=591202 RepID=A0A316EVE0_9BACT|nr:DNA/RNA non-specific endonuclease [Arcicella aurantiaca]PWK27156.1 endonuclease G [Arcicella aurantiaca]
MKKLLILLLISVQTFSQVKNISNATSKDKNNYYLPKKGYIISYNNILGHANWVGWTLKKTDIGVEKYPGVFYTDISLGANFKRVNRSFYSNTHYDRGHLCNSQARTSTVLLNKETYVMTNAVPQTPNLNRGIWKKYEDLCQLWALNNENLTIYAGGLGKIGTLSQQNVNIPEFYWKVIFGHGTQPLCLLFKNDDKTVTAKIVELSYIQSKTGYQF